MSAQERLDEDAIRARLTKHPAWSLEEDGKLRRELTFADFSTAFAFMSGVAVEAQAMNHHPEWSNVYSSVTIRLTTHDAGGISARDFALAEVIDRLAAALGA